VLNQTITVLQNSGKPEAGNQVSSVRQDLGNLYQQAGHLEAAEQTFQQAIAASAGRDALPGGYQLRVVSGIHQAFRPGRAASARLHGQRRDQAALGGIERVDDAGAARAAGVAIRNSPTSIKAWRRPSNRPCRPGTMWIGSRSSRCSKKRRRRARDIPRKRSRWRWRRCGRQRQPAIAIR